MKEEDLRDYSVLSEITMRSNTGAPFVGFNRFRVEGIVAFPISFRRFFLLRYRASVTVSIRILFRSLFLYGSYAGKFKKHGMYPSRAARDVVVKTFLKCSVLNSYFPPRFRD